MGAARGSGLCTAHPSASVTVMSLTVTVHRVPWSTNVERVALAAAHKGITVRWVDHDFHGDRAALLALSGQRLAPVLELDDGTVLADSPRILERFEALVPEPALWPAAPQDRALADIFVAWFNGVWKVAPNAIADAREAGRGGGPEEAELLATLRASRDRFEALLEGRDHLLSHAFGIADVIAFPFLKYAVGLQDGDDHVFHHVLHETLGPAAEVPRLAAWVKRVDARPRA